jgi:G6PDH family F420-dependent oxidoreductase
VYISGYGPQATGMAADVGDGYVTTRPDGDLIGLFRERGPGKPVTAGAKACVAASRDEAEKIAYKMWPTTGLPGELNAILPTPAHFEQAVQLVKPEHVVSTIPCGPDPQVHIAALRQYQDAGVDEVFVAPVGPHYREMLNLYAREVVPAMESD